MGASTIEHEHLSGTVEQWRILVVEDDDELRDVLVHSLGLAGLRPSAARTGREAYRLQRSQPADLVLLDIGLPDRDGLEIGRALREVGDRVPIIFLTARDELRDKLAAFDSGADDYLTKPFSLAELVARIRAVMARTAPVEADAVLRLGDLELDPSRHLVRRGGHTITLTATEFRLLQFLLVNAGLVVSRQQILTQVWRYDYDGNTSVVDNYISFLRRKLDDRDGRMLQTVRGVGYTLRQPGD